MIASLPVPYLLGIMKKMKMKDDAYANAYSGAFSFDTSITQHKQKKNKKFYSACACAYACVVGVLTTVMLKLQLVAFSALACSL